MGKPSRNHGQGMITAIVSQDRDCVLGADALRDQRHKFAFGPSVDFWAGTALVRPEFAPESWINVFTSERVDTHPAGKSRTLAIAEVLKRFPVALLVPAASALQFDKALSQATKWHYEPWASNQPARILLEATRNASLIRGKLFVKFPGDLMHVCYFAKCLGMF